MLSARNGEIEAVAHERRLGHRRACAGRFRLGLLRHSGTRRPPRSATPEHGRPRSRPPARSSHVTSRRCCRRRRRRAHGRVPARVDPLAVSTSDKGDLLVQATLAMAEHGADLGTGDVPRVGHPQVVRVERGPSHRPAHPRVRSRHLGDGDRRRRDAGALVSGGTRPVQVDGLGVRRASSTSRTMRRGSAPRRGRC